MAYVWDDRCISATGKKCGICERACPYGAIEYEQGKAAHVITAKCHGCGGCVAECPHNAITQMHFTDAQVLAQIRALLATEPENKILAFRCHWCSYGGADMAGTSHFEYTANERGLRVIIAGAGGAAHLPGMIASHTTVPVLGVPVESRVLRGVDSLLSIVQMPAGIPVGTLAIGVAGATNAGLLAAAIIGTTDPDVRTALEDFRRQRTAAVLARPDPSED